MRYRILALQQWRYVCAAAVQLLTRLPTPRLLDFNPQVLDRSVKYFPLVGLLVGGFAALSLYGASFLWAAPLPAFIAVGVSVILTGALHEDGLADFFDALGAFDKTRRLQIMKDSRIGAYGVLALIIFQGLRIFSLAALAPGVACAALLMAHPASRLATICVMAALPYAGEEGAAKINPLSGNISLQTFGIAAAFAVLPLALAPTAWVLAAYGAGALAAAFLAWRAKALLGGYTGDVLGAAEQCFEVAFLLGVAAIV